MNGAVIADADLAEAFVAFSAEVTAFTAVDLWGTGQVAAYLETVRDEAGDHILRELLDACQRGVDDKALGDDMIGPLARNIIKLWYSGTWYAMPPQWATRYGAPVKGVPAPRSPGQQDQPGQQAPQGRQAPYVVSAAAYTEGLLWRAVGAHPTGAKAPGYGSWAVPPDIEGYDRDQLKGDLQ
jgi:hypothetical protein